VDVEIVIEGSKSLPGEIGSHAEAADIATYDIIYAGWK
jgi:hypothetical protein